MSRTVSATWCMRENAAEVGGKGQLGCEGRGDLIETYCLIVLVLVSLIRFVGLLLL